MTHFPCKYLLMTGLAAALSVCSGSVGLHPHGGLVAAADARVGRPATPGVGAPGVGVTPGVGAGAPGVGVTPGVNLGGPVNRVGIR